MFWLIDIIQHESVSSSNKMNSIERVTKSACYKSELHVSNHVGETSVFNSNFRLCRYFFDWMKLLLLSHTLVSQHASIMLIQSNPVSSNQLL